MFNLTGLGVAAAAFAISGCAASHRGSVAMKVTETEAHVGLGADEVSEGDHVELFKNICTDAIAAGGGGRSAGGADRRSCRKELIGHGTVAKVLGADYSLVKFPDGTRFEEGDIIERHNHQQSH